MKTLATILIGLALCLSAWWWSFHKYQWHGTDEHCQWVVKHHLANVCAVDEPTK